MALSGSTNFSLNRDQLIKDALLLVGGYSEGETPTAFEINSASRTLNSMLKAWQADGLQLWTRKSKSVTLTTSKSSYTLGPTGDVVMDRPLRILKAVRRDSNSIDVPMEIISQDEYWQLSDKTSSGPPNQIYYDPQLTNGVLYIWPVTNTTGYTLELVYLKPYDDMDSATDDFEFPQEWLEAITWNLAWKLAISYGLTRSEILSIREQAVMSKQDADGFDQENASVFLQPHRRY